MAQYFPPSFRNTVRYDSVQLYRHSQVYSANQLCLFSTPTTHELSAAAGLTQQSFAVRYPVAGIQPSLIQRTPTGSVTSLTVWNKQAPIVSAAIHLLPQLFPRSRSHITTSAAYAYIKQVA